MGIGRRERRKRRRKRRRTPSPNKTREVKKDKNYIGYIPPSVYFKGLERRREALMKYYGIERRDF